MLVTPVLNAVVTAKEYMQAKLRSLFIMLALIAAVHPAPAQPTLWIAPAGRLSVLFWPTNAGNYILQSSTNLASRNWLTFSNAVPVTVNSNFNITVTNSSQAMFFRLYLDTNAPVDFTGMILIPAGVFTMGDTLDGESDAVPTNVTVSAFYMDSNLVSYSTWQPVFAYATTSSHGYGFYRGSGKAANHPVQMIDWYD